MDDFALALDASPDTKHAGREHNTAESLKDLGPDHEIGDARLVLDGDEHDAFGTSRTLTNQNEASGFQPAAVAGFHGFGTSHDAAFVEILP